MNVLRVTILLQVDIVTLSALVVTIRDRLEACNGVRNADEFSLRAINAVAKHPTTRGTVGIHLLSAVKAFAARADAGNQNLFPHF